MNSIGKIVDQKYEILTEIGRGGMSVVYLAMDRRLNKQWAIKKIECSSLDQDNKIAIDSLLKEANLMKKLDHPMLPRIVDIIDEDGCIYIVMDFIEGKTMEFLLEKTGPQSEKYVVNCAKQLCEALQYLHTRKPSIIYRDMKPANIMVKPDGNLRLIDFGIAREFKENQSKDTVCLGTRGYAAPEQFAGKGQTDIRTDIYCLGVTLYQMLTGKCPSDYPYTIYPIRHWNPGLSKGLEKIIEKCTQSDPVNRYQNCRELLYDLNHYEEVDRDFLVMQRKKLGVFFSSVMVTSLCLLSGFTFDKYYKNGNEERYQSMLDQAQITTDQQKKIELYEEALTLFGDRKEPYQEMIKAFKSDDGKFTIEEEKTLLKYYQKNKKELEENESDYIGLLYDIGKLYWFYYDYGQSEDNFYTRSVAALPWFEDILTMEENPEIQYENYEISRIYYEIGMFHRDYSTYVREAKVQEKANDYWKQMNDLAEYLVEHKDEDELLLWEGYRMIVDSMNTYMGKFLNCGIDENEIKNLCGNIKNQISYLEATDEMTLEIRESILQQLESDIPEKMEIANRRRKE